MKLKPKRPKASSIEARNGLVRFLRKYAKSLELVQGYRMKECISTLSEFARGKTSPARIRAIAVAHPDTFGYESAHRKTDMGCLKSKMEAGYYPAMVLWTVDYGEEDGIHVHDFGPVETSKLAGVPHRKCRTPGCKQITLDLE